MIIYQFKSLTKGSKIILPEILKEVIPEIYMLLLTFVIGPVMPFLPSPDTLLVGDSLGAFVLNEVMAWLTPGARVNCSRNSTLVRPLAANTKKDVS